MTLPFPFAEVNAMGDQQPDTRNGPPGLTPNHVAQLAIPSRAVVVPDPGATLSAERDDMVAYIQMARVTCSNITADDIDVNEREETMAGLPTRPASLEPDPPVDAVQATPWPSHKRPPPMRFGEWFCAGSKLFSGTTFVISQRRWMQFRATVALNSSATERAISSINGTSQNLVAKVTTAVDNVLATHLEQSLVGSFEQRVSLIAGRMGGQAELSASRALTRVQATEANIRRRLCAPDRLNQGDHGRAASSGSNSTQRHPGALQSLQRSPPLSRACTGCAEPVMLSAVTGLPRQAITGPFPTYNMKTGAPSVQTAGLTGGMLGSSQVPQVFQQVYPAPAVSAAPQALGRCSSDCLPAAPPHQPPLEVAAAAIAPPLVPQHPPSTVPVAAPLTVPGVALPATQQGTPLAAAPLPAVPATHIPPAVCNYTIEDQTTVRFGPLRWVPNRPREEFFVVTTRLFRGHSNQQRRSAVRNISVDSVDPTYNRAVLRSREDTVWFVEQGRVTPREAMYSNVNAVIVL
ncbi:hypothetical protein C8Q80DRAFT_1274808 [Daedaleopsis nitida]|nr:hypothetical protein C8Q80DRAFT_1274808 [Daedaleopsis nitida]